MSPKPLQNAEQRSARAALARAYNHGTPEQIREKRLIWAGIKARELMTEADRILREASQEADSR